MPRLALALALLLPLAACGSGDDPPEGTGSIADAANAVEALPPAGAAATPGVSGATIVDLVAEAPELSTMRRLLQETGLADALAAEGPFTLFAPSDDAFEAADLEALASDPEALRAVLNAHLLPFRTLSADMDFEQSVETTNGTMLEVIPGTPPAVASGGVRASIVRADLDAANGVVHVVDAILRPSN